MKRLFLLCCCLAAAVPFSARGESLERALRAVTDSVRATVGVAVVFGDGDTLAVNGGRCYPMLSVCKFHQALAVLDRLDRRGLPLTTRIPVRRSDLLSGTWSPLREACPGGGRFTVAELLTYSVAQSDNNVCDVLFRFLGGTEAVDRYIAGLGIGETVIVADNDIGIVRLPDGRSYSIAVFAMDSREDDRTNAAVIARISRLVYDYAARR